MSTAKAIGAVTERLLLVLSDQNATARPPDKAANSSLNLFLYHVGISAAWRNQDLPTANRTGQPRRPLLPLNLYYLISVGDDDQKTAYERLGEAMLALHDKPELTGFASTSGIKNQIDPIRVTFQPISLDDMSKMWSAFQTPYRPSIAYEVGVVLIESEIPETSPVPVTSRGDQDTGWDARAQFPAMLNSMRFPTPRQSGMRLGETVTLVGQNLNQAGSLQVEFRHAVLKDPLLLSPQKISDTEISVEIPDAPDTWPAGVYLVRLQSTVGTGDTAHTSSSTSIPIALQPEIEVPVAGTLTATQLGADFSLPVPCKPKLRAGQQVQVLIGSVVIDTVDISDLKNPIARWNSTKVKFPSKEGQIARLRVDGVDSLINDPAKPGQSANPQLIVQGLP